VSYTSPTNGQCIEGVAYIEDYKDSDKNQQLEITAKVSNSAEAKALAQKHLRMHNKYAKTASITLLGNPKVLAGVNADLENFGAFNGKYVVKQATHTVGSSGYTTKVELRCTVEGM
jgi:phage protein D